MVGEAHSLKVEKVLFQGKSDYQNVMVFQVIVIIILRAPKPSAIRRVPLLTVGDNLFLCFVFSCSPLRTARCSCAGWSDSGY
jgi:hypothetical protein